MVRCHILDGSTIFVVGNGASTLFFLWPIVIVTAGTKVSVFLELHSLMQTLTTRTHTRPYEHTYANPTPMSAPPKD